MANCSVSVWHLPDRPDCTLEPPVAKSTYTRGARNGIQTMRKLSTSLRELQTSDSISPELFNEVAQLGHFAAGLAVIWGSIVLFGSGSVWWAFGTLAVVAGVKEFWWDQHHESAVVRGSNFEDWSFYMLGATGAIVATAMEKLFFQK